MNNWIIEKLKKKGYKVTRPRQIVAEALVTYRGVFSVKELDLSTKIDLVSVYRTFDILAELDIIHPVISIHGEEHYELHNEKHHHHIVCQECEKTKCVPCNITKKSITGFINIHHSIIFTGICLACK
ncbi:MAG: hypothetical protein COX81_00225 [Candidatus Magasanikbacteria bacterium CG_4_10_14_0_2_um_filter_37_12]|uniref:Transcriptional repressor n=1 Tax=Candidatus Magasanikbacteria bacterium CG_4_10_14_0_2_um_filter_37_12 TaxID=1974637 RepID=A0A2M7VA90_9BACT|nr:MAG: hypothetical protein COX81_00225 [Candidatus Magasanikbacteria bacterium CG_4_10_14_0_2_um_filter_37_12]